MQKAKLTEKLNKDNIQDIKNILENYNERRLNKYHNFNIYKSLMFDGISKINAINNQNKEKEIFRYIKEINQIILFDDDFRIHRIIDMLEDYFLKDICIIEEVLN